MSATPVIAEPEAEWLEAVCPGCGTVADPGAPLLDGVDRLTRKPGSWDVLACLACDLAFTHPRPGPEEIGIYYPDSYSAYEPHASARRLPSPGLLLDRLRLEAVVRYGPYRRLFRRGPGRILDVGCSRGDLAAVFAAHGWEVAGIEPSALACAHAAARGIDVHCGTLDDAPWPAGSFDSIVFSHSLEHIDRPLEAVERAGRLLRPGGLLVIAVPNFGSWQRRRFGNRWFQLDLPRHLQHFDRDSLASLVRRAGLRPLAVNVSSMRPSLLASLQYRTFGRLRFEQRGFRMAGWAFLPAMVLLDRLAEGDCLHLSAQRD